MISQVDFDVRAEKCTACTLIKLSIGLLLMLGIAVTAAGLQHKRGHTKNAVSWHNVSDSLHQVERAKVDLFAALKNKSP